MAELPFNASGGTSYGVLNLALLQPGVTSAGAMGAGVGPSVGGQRPYNNSFTLEGVDNNRKDVTGPVTLVPNDAVAEFSVLTNQFSPEFGHSSGGQFNTVVKSGSNTIHGTVYEYFQNRNLNAIDQSIANNTAAGEKIINPRYDNNRLGGCDRRSHFQGQAVLLRAVRVQPSRAIEPAVHSAVHSDGRWFCHFVGHSRPVRHQS